MKTMSSVYSSIQDMEGIKIIVPPPVPTQAESLRQRWNRAARKNVGTQRTPTLDSQIDFKYPKNMIEEQDSLQQFVDS
jgi:hypothetical protein